MPLNFYLASHSNTNGERLIRLSCIVKSVHYQTTIGFCVSEHAWDSHSQEVKRGYKNSKRVPYNVINHKLKKLKYSFAVYEMGLEYYERPSVNDLKRKVFEILERPTEKLTKSGPGFYFVYDTFISSESRERSWADSTVRKFVTAKNHLKKFYPNMNFHQVSEKWINDYVHHLEIDLHMQDVSVKKELKLLKWFLRWAIKKKFCPDKGFLDVEIKTKETKKPVIFLEPEELMKLYHYSVPSNGTVVDLVSPKGKKYQKEVQDKSALEKARDLFCFCCFTSLRYSDMAQLQKKDIYKGAIHLVSQKTDDQMDIELIPFAKEILDKYEDLPGELALPVISNQKLNYYLKDLCELCGFNQLITTVRYNQGRRYDEVAPKYELISSHAGRRTFICLALSAGTPPDVVMKWTGHSDYASMKPYIDVTADVKSEAMKNFYHLFMKKDR